MMSSGVQGGFEFSEAGCGSAPIELRDASLWYFPLVFTADEADALLNYCLSCLPWRQDFLVIAGKRVAIPRLQNWFGDPDAHYSYSGLALTPLPWTAQLLRIRDRAESIAGQSFNAALANYYRNGRDSVGWHSDDEKELGPQPVIASVSLGATRVFEMRHRYDKTIKTLRLPLTHGSVLVMKGGTQQFWRHQLPKDEEVTQPRVNLTLRKILV
jgi:alkylated DNA repair dioxygenase AlkB